MSLLHAIPPYTHQIELTLYKIHQPIPGHSPSQCRITETFIDMVIKIIADVRPFIDLFLAVQWLKYGFCSRHVPEETSIFDIRKKKISE